MWNNRRRSDRPDAARRGLAASPEPLEVRQLLSRNTYELFSAYTPSDLSVYNPQTHDPIRYSVRGSLRHDPSIANPNLNNQGKIVSGKDRQGNEWTITVHGPGTVIVTDTSPTDGILDDAISTIQLVGTDIHRTYVTGNVVGSFYTPTDSTTQFNRLIDTSGVRSVILNGFSLAQTTTPATLADGTAGPANVNTGIFLTGGVQYLSFHNIIAPVDTSFNDQPVNVIIGDPSTPLSRRVQPTIKLDSVFNTVYDSAATTVPATPTPLTTPSVNIVVNGAIKDISFLSATQGNLYSTPQGLFGTIFLGVDRTAYTPGQVQYPAIAGTGAYASGPAYQYQYPTVGTTGRTAVQARSIRNLDVKGAATNFTASRSAQPFTSGFSGLSRLGTAHFHGPTDAVGLDVNGPIKSVRYDRGMGNPAGTFVGTNAAGSALPATAYGLPADQVGYPGNGLLGGQVTATRIQHVGIKPANLHLQTPTNPDFVQLYRQGSTAYFARPGNAMTSSLIASSGGVGRVKITGDVVNSEIKGGFHYGSFASGLEGTRAPSSIRRIDVAGNTLNGVTSATYRPFMHFYGAGVGTAGPGSIHGHLTGSTYSTGGVTPLGNTGTGFFARVKKEYLPPPERVKFLNGRLGSRG